MNTTNLTKFLQWGFDSNDQAVHALAVAAREELAEMLALAPITRRYYDGINKRTEAGGYQYFSLIMENSEIAKKFTRLAEGDAAE